MIAPKVVITGVDTVKKHFEKVAKEEVKALKKALLLSANLIKNDAVKSIREVSHSDKKVKCGKKWHTISKPGDAPNLDSGRLSGSIDIKIHDTSAEVRANVNYAAALEKGTKKMGARPFLDPALEKNRKKINDIFGKEISLAVKNG
jgi:HK97 gp10 family phage protein